MVCPYLDSKTLFLISVPIQAASAALGMSSFLCRFPFPQINETRIVDYSPFGNIQLYLILGPQTGVSNNLTFILLGSQGQPGEGDDVGQ